jgi:hypothetical protein
MQVALAVAVALILRQQFPLVEPALSSSDPEELAELQVPTVRDERVGKEINQLLER